jgi:hypothetical protein
MLICDIEPYRCVATGDRIRSRRHHRDHLKAHGYVEVGNEYQKGLAIDEAPQSRAMTEQGRREAIEQAIAQVAQGAGKKSAGAMDDLD